MALPSYRNSDIDRVRRELERAERNRARAIRIGTAVGALAGVVLVASLVFGVTRGQATASTEDPSFGSAAQSISVSPTPSESSIGASPAAEPSYTAEAELALPTEATVRKAAKTTPKSGPAEPEPESGPAPAEDPKPKAQRFRIGLGATGYEPSVVNAESGAPIVLSIEQGEGCAAGFLIPDLSVSADNSDSDATVKLADVDPGTYAFTCGMGMVSGKLIVK